MFPFTGELELTVEENAVSDLICVSNSPFCLFFLTNPSKTSRSQHYLHILHCTHPYRLLDMSTIPQYTEVVKWGANWVSDTKGHLARLISGQEGSDGEALHKGTVPTNHGKPDDEINSGAAVADAVHLSARHYFAACSE
jgi:hypothetical protein